jgi:hypothetical protein
MTDIENILAHEASPESKSIHNVFHSPFESWSTFALHYSLSCFSADDFGNLLIGQDSNHDRFASAIGMRSRFLSLMRRGIRCPDKFFDQFRVDWTICGRENSGGIVGTVTDGNYAMSDAIMELVHFPMGCASELNHSSQFGMRWLTKFDRRYISRKEASLPLE